MGFIASIFCNPVLSNYAKRISQRICIALGLQTIGSGCSHTLPYIFAFYKWHIDMTADALEMIVQICEMRVHVARIVIVARAFGNSTL